MKKNIMMRLAAFLLVAVLISTSAISGTYAKYVTSGFSEDTARVAKFGVNVEGATDMFHDSYLHSFTAYTSGEKLEDITVQADTTGTDIVAPGTNGVLSKFDISGSPEVDTLVTYAAEFDLGDNWVVDGDDYCPIVITIKYNGNTETYGMGYVDVTHPYTSVAAFEEGVIEAIEACAKRYHTNEDLSAAEEDFVISWAWPFSTSTENDEKDTKLGDAAVVEDNAGKIYLKITCSVTQID